MTCASLWRYYNVRVVQCIIIMASKIATALMCFYVWNSRNNKQKKKEIPHTKASGRDGTKRYGTSHTPPSHRLLPRNNNTTSHQQQQPAPRDNNLLKCKGKMDMMGKFLTRSNRSKTQEKEDEDDAWDFISSYRPYNFLFVLMFKLLLLWLLLEFL